MPSRLSVAIVALICSAFVIVFTLGSSPLICSSLAGSLGLENEGHWNCSAPRAGKAVNVQSVRPKLNAVLIMTQLLRREGWHRLIRTPAREPPSGKKALQAQVPRSGFRKRPGSTPWTMPTSEDLRIYAIATRRDSRTQIFHRSTQGRK